MSEKIPNLEEELQYLGLLEKAREIDAELGRKAMLSYIKSSHRLLSKVYHPDLNPGNPARAHQVQQRLNRVSDMIVRMSDDDLVHTVRNAGRLAAGGKRKILVVEDEFGLQELFRDILTMEGYEVQVAVDGDEGLRLYSRFLPELIITDVVMPKVSGLEMVQKIREHNFRIKVIYISGFFGIRELKQDLEREILRHGYPTLAKPFKVSAMLEVLNDYLQEKGDGTFRKGVL